MHRVVLAALAATLGCEVDMLEPAALPDAAVAAPLPDADVVDALFEASDTGVDAASPDSAPDAGAVDSSAPDATSNDAALLPAIVALGRARVAGEVGLRAHGAAFQGGAWESRRVSDDDAYLLGGIAFTGGGAALATFRDGGGGVTTARWDGAWTSSSARAPTLNHIGAPIERDGRTYAMVTIAGIGGGPAFAELDPSPGALGALERTGFGDFSSLTAVAQFERGDVIAVFQTRFDYRWSTRVDGTWTSTAAIVGTPTLRHAPPPVLVYSLAEEEVVGLFVYVDDRNRTRLIAARSSGGGWSSQTELASDLPHQTPFASSAALAPLADGRLAASYTTTTGQLMIAFLDAGSWSASQPIPGARGFFGRGPALASGIEGASLELAFVDEQRRLAHARLDARCVWSTPAVADATVQWDSVMLASRR